MLPVQKEFPKFVPDQLLTSEDLNNMFGYLDGQNRLTRTNLIGIGIVCGLQLRVNNGRTTVTITKGCGVTSSGYLVAVDTKSYSMYRKYKVDTPQVYDKFFRVENGVKVPIDIWELKEPGVVETDTTLIDASFLNGKTIFLFVELKEEGNKNCDPDSCDDKGVSVTVNFLPMAVTNQDAQILMGATSGSFSINTHASLPEMKLKRWDVSNTTPVYSQDIFDAYSRILNKDFIDAVECNLKSIYSIFGNLVAQEISVDPFNGLSQKFSFLYNGTANLNQLLNAQYYYDFFSDLLLAYNEFRKAGTGLLSVCCPDENLFPRHLLLGEAVSAVNTGILPLRHYFIYSPLFGKQQIVNELQSLFDRMVLMINNFAIPAPQITPGKEDENIRITPSVLSKEPLSSKAIPFYYLVNSGAKPLYLSWNYKMTVLNDAKRNLSYHAGSYNNTDEWVTKPLGYDLESYNFLRVEGILGKQYRHVLQQVKNQISKNRLPVDIIALNADAGHGASLTNLKRNDAGNVLEMLCHFQDIESLYDSIRNELLCMFCKELRYYYDFTFAITNAFLGKQTFAGQVSQASLFSICSSGYVIKNKALGNIIELLYRKGLTDQTLTIEKFFQALGVNVQDDNNDDIPDNFNEQVTATYMLLLNFFKVPLGIIRIAELLTNDLSEFDATSYCTAAAALTEYANGVKFLYSYFTGSTMARSNATVYMSRTDVPATTEKTSVSAPENAANTGAANTELAASDNPTLKLFSSLLLIEDLNDHLDILIYNCKCAALKSLKEDYKTRYLLIAQMRQFKNFAKLHPGLQHKAGVTMGGTFIIVYHSNKIERIKDSEITTSTKHNRFSGIDENEYVSVKEVSVAGVVVDEQEVAVAGAIVTLLETGRQTQTDERGIFRLASNVIPFTLLIGADGFLEQEITRTGERKIVVILKQAGNNELRDLREGTVIADFYLPYRCCSDCPPIQYVVTEPKEPEPPSNQGPKANAGADQQLTLPINKTRLDGSASADQDGVITFYQWAKLNGPGNPEIVTATSSQTDVLDLEEGEYVFELSVTDDKGAIARDTVNIKVNPAPPSENNPPVANAGADQQIVLTPNTLLILDGSQSKDEDGSIVSFAWKQTGGAAAVIQSPSLMQTVVVGLQPGRYEFELTVTDNKNASGSDTVVVTITAPENKPPVADAGADQYVSIANATLDGSRSKDPEGSVLNFKWQLLGGPNVPAIEDATKPVTNVSGLISGEYKFGLTVIDNKGAIAQDTVIVSVKISQPTKSCGTLSAIINEFSLLNKKFTAEFKTAFAFYEELNAYFKELRTIENLDADKHIEFFSKQFNQQETERLIAKWLNALQRNIILKRKDMRSSGLLLYRVLVLLSMYIVCIQKEDYDRAKVNMNAMFKTIHGHVSEWRASLGNLTAEEKGIIKRIASDIELEIQRVNDNGEAGVKQNYLEALKSILNILSAI